MPTLKMQKWDILMIDHKMQNQPSYRVGTGREKVGSITPVQSEQSGKFVSEGRVQMVSNASGDRLAPVKMSGYWNMLAPLTP